MTLGDGAAILLAGVAAGTVNAVVGSGTLITFPVMLATGYAPVTAVVSNAVGLVPGSAAGAVGYRRELRGQRARAVRLAGASTIGALIGAVLLLTLPASAFRAIVPTFIVLALVLIAFQPRISRLLMERRARGSGVDHALPVFAAVFATGVYGGYFGAAQGVILLAALGALLEQDLQHSNALKNVLVGVANLASAVVFIAVGRVAWGPVLLIATGALVGGAIGARSGRRLSPTALRALVFAVGVFALGRLVL